MARPELLRYRASSTWKSPEVHTRTTALLGSGGLEKLFSSKIAVIGLGGVGSWAAEFLARSYVGELHIFDFDEVEKTNTNRQLQSFPHYVGEKKAILLHDRLNRLYEEQKIITHCDFVDDKYMEKLNMKFDFIVEAIDHITAKASILAWAYNKNVPVVTSLGAGSRIDSTQVRCADLSNAIRCPMGSDLRKILRRKYNLPRNGEMGISSVYSLEGPWNSENPDIFNGTIAPVTSAFGSALASYVIKKISLP
jgi:tRNA threonylcarbamoyladenosine dehydratase